jgi:uncharacterized protein (TIGR00299 family) protein
MQVASALAVIDCPTGLAGNMLLAALLDCGVPPSVVEEPLVVLGLQGAYRIQREERRSGGLRGLHLEVESLEPQPSHRHWGDLREQIGSASLPLPLKERVLQVFGLLAEAEAAVHGHAPEQVHFHEVGAIDALVDVVGVCAGLQHLGVEQLICAPPPAGHGQVNTAHGLLPLPAPAVLELARRHAVPLAGSEGFPSGELTTPTGLALMAAWADRFAPPPALTPLRVGVGLGSRTLDRPNLLRLILAQPSRAGGVEHLEVVLQQQAQIDDATAEDLAFLQDQLRQAGALEVFSQPVVMKKGRLASLITVLAWPHQAESLRAIWWRHGSSLGVREQILQRWALPRQLQSCQTPWGPVQIKTATRPDGSPLRKPELEDLRAMADRLQIPLPELRRRMLSWLEQEEQT